MPRPAIGDLFRDPLTRAHAIVAALRAAQNGRPEHFWDAWNETADMTQEQLELESGFKAYRRPGRR